MLFSNFLDAVVVLYIWALSTVIVSANPVIGTTDIGSWSPHGDMSSTDIMRAVRRKLSDYGHSLEKRSTVFKNSTTLERSWDGAVLLSVEA